MIELLSIAVLGAIVLLLLLERMIRDVGLGAGLIVLLSAVVATFELTPGVNLGGFSVTVSDVLLGLLATAVLARLLRRARPGRAAGVLFGVTVLVFLSLTRGIGDFGYAAAVNESRGVLGFFAAVFYFATVEPTAERRDRIARVWFGYAGFLVLLAVLRWLSVLGPLPLTGEWATSEEYGGLRVLWSDETLVLAQTFLVLLPALLRDKLSRGQRVATAAVFSSVLLLQHRSVWAVTLVGATAVLIQEGHIARRWAARLIGVTAVAAVLLLTLLSGPLLERTVASSDAANSGTFEWRMESWRSLYRDSGPESVSDAVIGLPYGTGWERRLVSLGYSTDVPPHNFYVELSLRVGILGVCLLVVAHAVLLKRLWRAPVPFHPSMLNDRTLFVLLLTQLVYYIPYWPSSEQGILLGLAIAAARQRALPNLPTRRTSQLVT